MATFVEARLALHFGRWSEAAELFADLPTGKDAWWQVRHWYFERLPMGRRSRALRCRRIGRCASCD